MWWKKETIIHISECNKLVQKEYKNIQVRVGKVIYIELCKKLKFDHNIKRYMRKPESIPGE